MQYVRRRPWRNEDSHSDSEPSGVVARLEARREDGKGRAVVSFSF